MTESRERPHAKESATILNLHQPENPIKPHSPIHIHRERARERERPERRGVGVTGIHHNPEEGDRLVTGGHGDGCGEGESNDQNSEGELCKVEKGGG